MPLELVRESLSEFGRIALTLDEEMRRFEGLAAELERLNLDSDKGLSRAEDLLKETTSSRESLGVRMTALVQILGEAQKRNEKAEQVIAARTQAFHARQSEVERMVARFQTLSENVQHLNQLVNQLVSKMRHLFEGEQTKPEVSELAGELKIATEPMTILIKEAKVLVEDARFANMKNLELNADSLHKSLQSAKNRLHLITDRS